MKPIVVLTVFFIVFMPILGYSAGYLMGNVNDIFSLNLLLMYVMTAVTGLMTLMWFGDLSTKNLNGMKKWAEEDRKKLMKYMGMFCSFAMVVLSAGIAISISGKTWGLYSIIPSFVLILYPLRFCLGDGFPKETPLSESGLKVSGSVTLVLCLLTVTPFCLLDSSDAVDAEFGETSVHIKAPMFDHDFAYGDIEELRYEEHFDKGYRQFGFGTDTLKCGKFKNDEFGKYELASYAKVEPCITFLYHGSHYAFNQSSAEKTLEAFEILKSKIGP